MKGSSVLPFVPEEEKRLHIIFVNDLLKWYISYHSAYETRYVSTVQTLCKMAPFKAFLIVLIINSSLHISWQSYITLWYLTAQQTATNMTPEIRDIRWSYCQSCGTSIARREAMPGKKTLRSNRLCNMKNKVWMYSPWKLYPAYRFTRCKTAL